MDQSTDRNLKNMLESRGIHPDEIENYPVLIFLLMRAFLWMDNTLQENRAERGEDRLNRNESLVMMLVAVGVRRPIEVARSLGVSRQALNVTINLLKDRGLIELTPDPNDRRCKVIAFAEAGQSVRDGAMEILSKSEQILSSRIGRSKLSSLYGALSSDWGPTPIFDVPNSFSKDE